ncbi:MAG: hypothetical protein ACRCXT_10155 [Paraclostridium sp.]
MKRFLTDEEKTVLHKGISAMFDVYKDVFDVAGVDNKETGKYDLCFMTKDGKVFIRITDAITAYLMCGKYPLESYEERYGSGKNGK